MRQGSGGYTRKRCGFVVEKTQEEKSNEPNKMGLPDAGQVATAEVLALREGSGRAPPLRS